MHKYVIVIPDGAADTNRYEGRSPLQVAQTPNMDFVARAGICGLMQTLYGDLPRDSMVAQLGMLGWDPRIYHPCGRASAELLACHSVHLSPNDIAFRANLVRMHGEVLESYSANLIPTLEAQVLASKLHVRLRKDFPEFELYHHSDFRNTLIVRNAHVDPRELRCAEPHECQGHRFTLGKLLSGSTDASEVVAQRVNQYVQAAAVTLQGELANALFPWSASRAFQLPSFPAMTGFQGRMAIVGFMDFLLGIAKAGNIEFFRVGNGRPNTDYAAKGAKVVELLEAQYACVVCHINAPDEASHLGDLKCKCASLQSIDRFIVRPILGYFRSRIDELGGVVIVPDHYSNVADNTRIAKRSDSHSLQPVPFALWNNWDRDLCVEFSESEAARGRYGRAAISHLDLLPLLFAKCANGRKKTNQGNGYVAS